MIAHSTPAAIEATFIARAQLSRCRAGAYQQRDCSEIPKEMSCNFIWMLLFLLLSLSPSSSSSVGREKERWRTRIGDRLGVETPVAADKLDEWYARPPTHPPIHPQRLAPRLSHAKNHQKVDGGSAERERDRHYAAPNFRNARISSLSLSPFLYSIKTQFILILIARPRSKVCPAKTSPFSSLLQKRAPVPINVSKMNE